MKINWRLTCTFFKFNFYKSCVVIKQRKVRFWLIFYRYSLNRELLQTVVFLKPTSPECVRSFHSAIGWWDIHAKVPCALLSDDTKCSISKKNSMEVLFSGDIEWLWLLETCQRFLCSCVAGCALCNIVPILTEKRYEDLWRGLYDPLQFEDTLNGTLAVKKCRIGGCDV